MKKLSKKRILNILETHCVTEPAELLRAETDDFGDTVSTKKLCDCTVYFSALLHRYNPYVDFKYTDTCVDAKRYTPMAILPYDTPMDISSHDILRLKDGDYTISFVEDIKGYYYLLSLSR